MPQNEGVLDKVKRTFLRMTSPFDVDLSKLDPLVSMNYPPMMARRDASYDRAVSLLRGSVFSRTESERRSIYTAAGELLDDAILNTKIILAPLKRGMKAPEKEPMFDYLKLLRDTVESAKTLASHQVLLSSNEKELSSFLGPKMIESFHSSEDIFSDSEMNIYHCLLELIEGAEAAILRYREHRKRAFDKSDLERYCKAFSEFSSFYSKTGKLQ